MHGKLTRFLTLVLSAMLMVTTVVPFAYATEPLGEDQAPVDTQDSTSSVDVEGVEENNSQIQDTSATENAVTDENQETVITETLAVDTAAENADPVAEEPTESTNTAPTETENTPIVNDQAVENPIAVTDNQGVDNAQVNNDAPVSDTENVNQEAQVTPSDAANVDTEPVPVIVPEDQELETAKESVVDSITDAKVKRNPNTKNDGPVGNDTELKTTFSFKTAKSLDRLEIVVKNKNTLVKSFEIDAIGDTSYSVYKYYKVAALDDKGELQTTYPAMPVEEDVSGAESQKITGADIDYFEFPNVDPNDDAVFLKEYRIIFPNGIKADSSIKVVVNSIMDSVDSDSAKVSINAVATIGESAETFDIGDAKYSYAEPVIEMQEQTDIGTDENEGAEKPVDLENAEHESSEESTDSVEEDKEKDENNTDEEQNADEIKDQDDNQAVENETKDNNLEEEDPKEEITTEAVEENKVNTLEEESVTDEPATNDEIITEPENAENAPVDKKQSNASLKSVKNAPLGVGNDTTTNDTTTNDNTNNDNTSNDNANSDNTKNNTNNDNKIEDDTVDKTEAKYGILEINVVTKEDSKPLANIELSVKRDGGENPHEYILVTDESGKAIEDKIIVGKYIVTQSNVSPDGDTYTGEAAIEIKENEKLVLNIVDDRVEKVIPEGYGIVEITVLANDTEEPIEGAEINILDRNGAVAATLVTDSEGKATTENMPAGTYSVKQVTTKEGYLAPSKAYDLEIPSGTLMKFTIKNAKDEAADGGRVILTALNADTNEPIEGVQFTLVYTDADGNEAQEAAVSNSDGTIEFTGLENGDYRINITKVPETFENDNQFVEFTVTDDQRNFRDEIKLTPAEEVDPSELSGTIKIVITDKGTKEGIPNISFVIKDSSNEIISNLTTDENGETEPVIVTGGTYTVEQKTLPEDEYIIDEKVKDVAITKTNTDQVVNFQMTSKASIKGRFKVTVTNADTKEFVQDAVFVVYNMDDEEVTRFTTDYYGVALSEKLPFGQYKIVLEVIPAEYVQTKYQSTTSISASVVYASKLSLKPVEPEKEPDPAEIVDYHMMEFVPETAQAVPNSPFDYHMNNYSFEYNEDVYHADHVKFIIKQVKDTVHLRALFDGSVDDYQVTAITSTGAAVQLPKTNDDITKVDFDSRLIVNEDGTNKLPEGTRILWLTVYGPKNGFKVNEFYIHEDMPETFEDYKYTVETQVYEAENDEPIKKDIHTGNVTHGEPQVEVTMTTTDTIAYVNQPVSATFGFANLTGTAFKTPVITIQTPDVIAPTSIAIGEWTNYTGLLDVTTQDKDGNDLAAVQIDPAITDAVTLTGSGSIASIKITPTVDFVGTEAISNVVLEGIFTSDGDVKFIGTFNGVVTDTITTEASAEAVITIASLATPTPAPDDNHGEGGEVTPPGPEDVTPTTSPSPEDTQPTAEPTKEPDNGVTPPHGGGNQGGNSGTDTEPEPTEVPLTLSSPNIYGNTNAINYGDSGVFNIRNIGAVGLKTNYYYVLHLMIPTGVQVRSVSIPNFGGTMRVSLVYNSGSADLGTFTSANTVSLTEKEGSNLRYIAFQMKGVTEAAVGGEEVSLLLKNITSRDRVATLQAILSIRDEKTSVVEQNTDKYNISLSGPKTSVNANPSPSKSSSSSSNTSTTGTSTETGDTANAGTETIYDLLLGASTKEGFKANVLDIKTEADELYPLTIPMSVYGFARYIDTQNIPIYKITKERVDSFSKKLFDELKYYDAMCIKYGNSTYSAVLNPNAQSN